MCTAKGSDVRPGVRLASVGLRLFCVAGVGPCALPRGRMYALGFGWRPWVSASFAWQAWVNVHCQGVGCTPWGLAGVPGSPPLLRGSRGTMCTAKGSDVRPGVRLASLGLRLFCVAGVGQCALPRGRMYALGFRLASLGLRLFCVAAVGQCALPRGLASLGLRLFCVAGVPQCALLRGRRGTMCTAKGTMCIAGGFCVAGVGHCAHTLSHSLTHSHSFHHSPHSLNHSCTHSLTDSLDITLLRDTHTYSYCVSAVASWPQPFSFHGLFPLSVRGLATVVQRLLFACYTAESACFLVGDAGACMLRLRSVLRLTG